MLSEGSASVPEGNSASALARQMAISPSSVIWPGRVLHSQNEWRSCAQDICIQSIYTLVHVHHHPPFRAIVEDPEIEAFAQP